MFFVGVTISETNAGLSPFAYVNLDHVVKIRSLVGGGAILELVTEEYVHVVDEASYIISMLEKRSKL